MLELLATACGLRQSFRSKRGAAFGKRVEAAEQHTEELLFGGCARLETVGRPCARPTNARSGQPPKADTSIAAKIIDVATRGWKFCDRDRAVHQRSVSLVRDAAVKLDSGSHHFELRTVAWIHD